MERAEPTIEVKIKGMGIYQLRPGISLGELCKNLEKETDMLPLAGIIDNNLRDMQYELEQSCKIQLLDLNSEIGARIYRRSATLLLIKACRDIFPDRKLLVKHTLSNGLYCEFLREECSKEEIAAIEKRMREIVSLDLPINKHLINKEEASRIFSQQGQEDKFKLLEYRDKESVHVFELDGFYEYFYDYMVNRTGIIKQFRLIQYSPGMVLQTPEVKDNYVLKEYREQNKLANIYQETKDWAEMLQTPHVAAVNEAISYGKINDIIRVNEALHEKKIAYIADRICADRKIRVVLISGPSSSGKTTFAQRLMIQLRVNGRKPVAISLDNYFIDKVLTPRDENGDYDFEALGALKLDLFNEHLGKLIKGEEVEVPVYNFKTGTSEGKGIPLRVPDGEPIIIEGIHGLNDQLTWSIPTDQKFKIYVSALTQLNLDYTNRIPTTDCRLIRRIIRDSRTRGYSASNTIKRWPSVRRGEEKNIFPFQENADVMFNTSLVYELFVLKPFIEPLLQEIGAETRVHVEAKRLLKFLSYFRSVPTTNIPSNSILCEFVGGSWFDV